MKKIINVICLLLFFSSVEAQENKDIYSLSEPDSCINNELYKCVDNHIKKTKWLFAHRLENICYAVHFFKKSKTNYFTIWVEYYLPYTKKKTYQISYYKIQDIHVAFIKNKKDKLDIYNQECMLNSIEWGSASIVYDGSLYPRTYTYYKENGEYKIEKSKKTLFPFYSDFDEPTIEYFKKLEDPVNL